MENIALAKNIKFIPGENKNQGKIEISPLFPGYGITLGNSVRRVLLASLIGAAPIGIKIKGVNHEFTSIPYIKEDILEIVLNLKKLRLKSFSEEIVKLELDVHGKKKITAADINKNSEVKIANKDLFICEITDMAGNLNMEILIAKGRGYDTIEGRKGADEKNKDINYIEMDSIFTPVLKIGVNIENVRVGKMTNWDKLIIDLETDGTVSPEEAYEEAVRILIKQFKAVKKIGGSTAAKTTEDKPEEK
ncbi:MAG: DNA-directed RNA polymerase subunit alpha [Patescibacteria group bacterium]|nr:DNA-directed RNA polymerase subunit alpha [Patescibacteria group bacterium]